MQIRSSYIGAIIINLADTTFDEITLPMAPVKMFLYALAVKDAVITFGHASLATFF